MEDFNREIISEEIIQLLRLNENEKILKEKLDIYHDYELARVLILLEPDDRKELYKILPIKKLTEVFEELDPKEAFLILKDTSLEVIVSIFKEMETDDLVDIINTIEDKEDRITYLSLIEVHKRVVIKSLLDFEKGLVGAIMNNDFVAISKSFT
ncbi:MAG: hypothetical protein WC152_03935, partial [Candidatus Izemoplasmatales bacterium]